MDNDWLSEQDFIIVRIAKKLKIDSFGNEADSLPFKGGKKIE